jgi:hypothetical protein
MTALERENVDVNEPPVPPEAMKVMSPVPVSVPTAVPGPADSGHLSTHCDSHVIDDGARPARDPQPALLILTNLQRI